jgi:membrane protease subunit HflK
MPHEHKKLEINSDIRNRKNNSQLGPENDSAIRSFSEALRISFIILKLVMIALIIFFISSGFRTVKSGESAIVLRFGKIRGTGDERVLKSRSWPYWIFPYPIEQMITIPVEQPVDLDINSFWYFQTDEERLSGQRKPVSPSQPLNPLVDGYTLTRSDIKAQGATAFTESDYNILHTRWRLTYQIVDPVSFYKNIYIEQPLPNQVYFDVVKKNLAGLLLNVFDSSVVSTMVNYTIDEALYSQFGTVADNVKGLTQKKLDTIQSGIRIVSVQRIESTWPMQVNDVFIASQNASQFKQQLISEATTYAQTTINDAGGPAALELYQALKTPGTSDKELESLWQQVAGKAQQKIADARAYRKKVVESARADADYLKQILPEYQKRPLLVISEIYRNAMTKILDKANEKFFIDPVKSDKGSEVRIQYNSDPALKPQGVK